MMGIREKVKKGDLSSEAALELAQSFDPAAPELEGWLRRRIARGADEADQVAREKAAAAAKAALEPPTTHPRTRQRRRRRGGKKLDK